MDHPSRTREPPEPQLQAGPQHLIDQTIQRRTTQNVLAGGGGSERLACNYLYFRSPRMRINESPLTLFHIAEMPRHEKSRHIIDFACTRTDLSRLL